MTVPSRHLDRIELGNVSPRTDPFTISFWFKNNVYKRWEADQDHILSPNGGQAGRWNVHLSGDPAYLTRNGRPKLEFFQDGYGATLLAPVIKPGIWHHVALVRGEELQDNFRIYLNGEMVHAGTIDPAAITLTETSQTDGIARVRATISPATPEPTTRFMRLKVEFPESP